MKNIHSYKKEINFILISFLLVVYFSTIIVKYPMLGIEVEKIDGNYQIVDLDDDKWAAKQGIKRGDIIKNLDREPPEFNSSVNMFSRVEKVQTIHVQQGETERKYNVMYEKGDKQFTYHLFMPLLYYLIFISSCLFIIIYNGRKNNNWSNYLLQFLTLFSLTYISSIAYGRMDVLGMIVMSSSFNYSLVLFLLFLNAYFNNRNEWIINTKTLNFLQKTVIILLISTNALRFFYNRLGSLINGITFLILLFTIMFLLVRFIFRNKQNVKLEFIKAIIISFLISLIPFIFFFVIPSLFLGKELIEFEISIIFFLFIPTYFFYLLISRDLFDVNFIISRLKYYLFISLIVSGLILIMEIIVFDKKFELENVLDFIQVNIVTFIFIIVSYYFKDYLDFKFRKILYDHKKIYSNSLNRFLHQMKSEYKQSDLIKVIKREFIDVLAIKEIIFLQINNVNQEIEPIEGKVSLNYEVLKKVKWCEFTVGSVIWIEGYFIVVVSDLNASKVVLICDRESLSIDEILWLETISNYIHLQFEATKKLEDFMNEISRENSEKEYVNRFARLSLMISEKERGDLSRDIHDGVLQDQLRLYRKMEGYKELFVDEKVVEVLNEIKEELMDQIYIVRETCNNLRPPFLKELGLQQSLQRLFKKISFEANFHLNYDIQEKFNIRNLEYENAIYRIIQELLNNALKHSQASVVYLYVFEEAESIYLVYKDDGIGMKTSAITESYTTMGISGVVTRVKSLNGEIKINSNIGQGLEIDIKFN
ncbi:ATP-binding protein [Bacillus paranthracis]|uniref:sensor histidine kinase n=1 Tax=Bacillus paranthracis TaxID=2026186 RepID=UPI00065BEDD5|nr:ATPase [Bacillus cereus]